MKNKTLVTFLVLVAIAGSAVAGNFRAADTIYMPAAGRVQGAAFFKTDVFVTNVDTSAAEVTIVYLPTGATADYSNPSTWTTVDLPQLAAGATVELEDIIGTTFGLSSGFGHLLFFACAAGADCSSGCDGGNCRSIVVEGRVYAEATGSACPNATSLCTLGQLFSGLPWYSYAGSSLASEGQDKVKILGLRQFGGTTPTRTGFRSNIGLVNASQTSSITLLITLFDENDTQFNTASVTLGPLAHTQQNVSALFAGFTGTGYAIVEQTGGSSEGFFAYGSTLDNTSDDPTTMESSFLSELDYVTVFGAKPGGGIPRPISHPKK